MYRVVPVRSRSIQLSLLSYSYFPLPRSLPQVSLFITIFLVSFPAFSDHLSHWDHPAEAEAEVEVEVEVEALLGPRMKLKRKQNDWEGWPIFGKRENSRTDICLRWSHQSVLVNDTVYIYGGQAKISAGQTSNTWNNDFLTLSLGEGWDIAAPKLTGLPQLDELPAVANGYLWHNYENIYLYGGLFSDNPPVTPDSFALWQYNLASGQWSDITSKISVSSDSGGETIERAAEGAGASIPERGLGFYFGGHLDAYTIKGWSIQTARVYLKSLLQFDTGKNQFLNVTENGLQEAGVPERADGVLVFVPWGKEGILVSIGGGRNDTFSQLNIIDIYDLSTRTWTKQATDGSTPQYRVNPCAVVGSASDGSSHNIYFFGGQNLVPYGDQTQFSDMWILTIPSFSWIEVDTDGQPVPPARAGHTCELHGSEMVVIGGYVGQELSCDSPGIYVFDASSAQWKTSYTYSSSDKSPAEFYQVPQIIISKIGGDPTGGATVTQPVQTPDPDSPVATGQPGDYKYTTITSHTASVTTATVTNSDGRVIISTTTSHPPAGSSSQSDKNSPNIGLIIGLIIGGIVLLVILVLSAAYAWYKKKIKKLREASEKLVISNGHSRGASGDDVLMAQMEWDGSEMELVGEPTFWGVLLSPRRSLRVINH